MYTKVTYAHDQILFWDLFYFEYSEQMDPISQR